MDGNRNFAKPEGDEGRDVLYEMNAHHRDLTLWGLSKLGSIEPKNILDIGCGGGMLISLLGEMFQNANIYGIDHSDEAVKLASGINQGLIENKRCIITKESVSIMPFDDDMFDLVTAVETYYFWPDLESDVSEACRVLSYGGKIMVLAESYPHPDFDERNEEYKKAYGINLIHNEEMKGLLESNGLDVKVHTIEEKNWVVFIGTKRN